MSKLKCCKCKMFLEEDDCQCAECVSKIVEELDDARGVIDDLEGDIEDREDELKEHEPTPLSIKHEEFLDALQLLRDKYITLGEESIEQIINLSK